MARVMHKGFLRMNVRKDITIIFVFNGFYKEVNLAGWRYFKGLENNHLKEFRNHFLRKFGTYI